MAEHDMETGTGGTAPPNGAGANGSGGAARFAPDGAAEFLERSGDMAKPLTDIGRANMEALVVSSKVAVRAAESISREATEYARKSCDDAFTLVRSLTEVRSPVEAVRLQTDYARTSFQNMMAFTNAMGEALTRMASEVTSAAAAPTSREREGSGDR